MEGWVGASSRDQDRAAPLVLARPTKPINRSRKALVQWASGMEGARNEGGCSGAARRSESVRSFFLAVEDRGAGCARHQLSLFGTIAQPAGARLGLFFCLGSLDILRLPAQLGASKSILRSSNGGSRSAGQHLPRRALPAQLVAPLGILQRPPFLAHQRLAGWQSTDLPTSPRLW